MLDVLAGDGASKVEISKFHIEEGKESQILGAERA
jgi:hypothetical protein